MDLLISLFDMVRWPLVVLICCGMVCGTITDVVESMWSED